MTFVDTNYFLRFLLNDVFIQKEKVDQLFIKGSSGQDKLFTNTVVIFEIYWVVKNGYGLKNPLTKKFLLQVCSLDFINLDDRQILINAVKNFEKFSYDFEDAYHFYFAKSRNISTIATFDKKLANKFKTLK